MKRTTKGAHAAQPSGEPASTEELAQVEALERTFEELRGYLWRHAQTMAEFDGSLPGKLAAAAARFQRHVVSGTAQDRLRFAAWVAGAAVNRLRRRPNVNPFKEEGRLPRLRPELLALATPPSLAPEERVDPERRRQALGRWLAGKGRALEGLATAERTRTSRQARQEAVAAHVRGERVVLFPPVVDWHEPLFQRPHQLALAYGRLGYRVVFVSDAHRYDEEGLYEVGPGVVCVAGLGADELREALREAADVIVSASWTKSRAFIDTLSPRRLIYELIDELEVFAGYDAHMQGGTPG